MNHITNQTSYIATNKKICVYETIVSNSDMGNFFTTSKVDSTNLKKLLKFFIKKLWMHTHLKIETKHFIECKNKLKDFQMNVWLVKGYGLNHKKFVPWKQEFNI